LVAPEANASAGIIYDWIAKHSPAGADRWCDAYLEARKKLETIADRCSLAHESERLGEPLRQYLFSTRKGHRYRIIFRIVGAEVHILHVRGAGQADIA
jgi:plasmid stabilization system protein ParE